MAFLTTIYEKLKSGGREAPLDRTQHANTATGVGSSPSRYSHSKDKKTGEGIASAAESIVPIASSIPKLPPRCDAAAPAPAKREHLWDKAYDDLRLVRPDLVTQYEEILSRDIESVATGSSTQGASEAEARKTSISQTDIEVRWHQMCHQLSWWLDNLDNHQSSQLQHSLRDHIRSSTGAMPPSALAWICVCYASRILLYPRPETEAACLGLIDISAKMNWYNCLPRLITGGTGELPEWRQTLQERVVALYTEILSYMMEAAILADNQFDTRKLNLARLKAAEEKLWTFGGSLMVQQLDDIRKLSAEKEARQKSHPRELITRASNGIDQKMAGLGQLETALSPVEMNDNEILVHGVSRWLCSTKEFKRVVDWATEYTKDCESNQEDRESNRKNQGLLIDGGPGINKTALMEAIARQLSSETNLDESDSHASISRKIGRVDSKPIPWASSYYSCSRTNHGIENSTRVLRGLIHSILKRQPHLMFHLDEALYVTQRDQFDSPRDFTVLSGVFFKMLKDQDFVRSYLVVDGIDSCSSGDGEDVGGDLGDLLRFIKATEKFPDKIKWLVSADMGTRIKTELVEEGHFQYVVLEEAYRALELTETFCRNVSSMVDELAVRKNFSMETKSKISRIIGEKSRNNVLWAVMACATLRKEEGWYAVEVLEEMPTKLDELYGYARMGLGNLPRRDPEFCKSVLSTMAIAYRPLHVSELVRLVDLPPQVDLKSIIGKCGSYLEVQSGEVKFVDPTARHDICEHFQNKLTGFSGAHSLMTRKTLEYLSEYFKKISWDEPSSKSVGFSTNYGAIHWLMHLLNVQCISKDAETSNAVITFIQNYFLLWLNVMITDGLYTDVAILMKKLEDFLIQQAREEDCIEAKEFKDKRLEGGTGKKPKREQQKGKRPVLSLVRDALHVIYSHRSGNSVFHTNPNSVIFYREKSALKQHWVSKNNNWLVLPPIIAQRWGDDFLSLANRGAVRSLAFSPDGRFLASGSNDLLIRLWDIETGAVQLILEKHAQAAVCLTFSSNGRLASGSKDGVIHMWDINTGYCDETLVCPQEHGSLWDIRFSPDGKQLLAGTDGALLSWDVSNPHNDMKKTPKEFKDSDCAHAVDISSSGKWIAAGGALNTVKIWNAFDENKLSKTLEGHTKDVTSVSFSRNEKHLISGSRDGTAKLWAVNSEHLIQTLNCGDTINGVAYSPDGFSMAIGFGSQVCLWGYKKKNTYSYSMEAHTNDVMAVAFSSHGRLASGSKDNMIKLWGLGVSLVKGTSTNVQNQRIKYGLVNFMAMSPDGKYLASSSGQNIYLWDGMTGQPAKHHVIFTEGVTSIMFSPNGKQLVSSSARGTVTVWDAASGDISHDFRGHSGYVRFATFSPKGDFVASASNDCTVRIWHCPAEGKKGGKEEQDGGIILCGHGHFVKAVAFSPDETLLASGGCDSKLIIWDLKSREKKCEVSGLSGDVESITFCENSSYVVSRSKDCKVCVWDSDNGACIQGPISVGRVRREVFFDFRMPEYFLTEFGADPSTFGSCAFFGPQSLKGKRYGISVAGDWITWNGRQIIPIPKMYRPTASWVQGNIVAIGTESGNVLLFRFAPDVEPPN